MFRSCFSINSRGCLQEGLPKGLLGDGSCQVTFFLFFVFLQSYVTILFRWYPATVGQRCYIGGTNPMEQVVILVCSTFVEMPNAEVVNVSEKIRNVANAKNA